MLNFTFQNPTKIIFGKGSIENLKTVLSRDQKIMMITGKGSIKKNGVYDQIIKALEGYDVIEFWGIEPNPRYEMCMKAVEKAKAESVDFLLAAGGGSALDATKFIAAAMKWSDGDPWDILSKGAKVESAVPLGCVLTLPATGSEMNAGAVITRESKKEKFAFISEHIYPKFSILDPAATFTLPERQTINGIIDAYVHVLEQYITYNVNAPLQDRQAEAILMTLIAEGPKVKADPFNYDARANIMWCAAQALNGTISCGVPQDWATHMIGHELTALFGVDHAQSLAIILPGLWKHQREQKKEKLIQYAHRVWGVKDLNPEETIDIAVNKTVGFFENLGMRTRLIDYGIKLSDCRAVVERFEKRGTKLGEHRSIGAKQVEEILALCE
ncbi:MAG: iron-containing alcohol dehydrogenase [Actinobacteria bacterium]|nr:iron-containing alcohol dehydrogenase [Actinomycetota bacterium]